ncbi:DNA metabolism protein [Lithospermum erythrorhizon]|uniref:PHD finger protein ALFIN-LIKE n=1 Tax=Lithospermum erythrorhizon TaxID=34254 RepID=A0AAV3NGZ3_LITER
MEINFARDLMDTMDWLSLVAIHSDAWLLAVALFYAANVTNDKSDRAKLFTKINNLPIVLEVFTDYMKNVQEGTSRASKRRNKSSISESQRNCSNSNPEAEVQLLDEENDDKNGESFCGACGEIYVPGKFWIFCDVCEKWFHGLFVKITPAKAERIKLYRCPSCNKKVPGA